MELARRTQAMITMQADLEAAQAQAAAAGACAVRGPFVLRHSLCFDAGACSMAHCAKRGLLLWVKLAALPPERLSVLCR